MSSIEKRAMFLKRMVPLLEFGREREGIHRPKVVLTHHNLKNRGPTSMVVREGLAPLLRACRRGRRSTA